MLGSFHSHPPAQGRAGRLLHFALAILAVVAVPAAWTQTNPPTGAVQSATYTPAPSRAVGEITLAVGPAVRTSAEGVPETVQRGTRVMPGDRFETSEGGMVHIRFVDGALVSLRPGSRLWVQDYQFNPQRVSESLVRFRLDQGVARAISGAAAEGAKDRFRLNTPLVAIGVRGTDFVVRTSDQGTSAAVNQGAIVMAPFDAGCLAQALGPCTSPGAKLLSADMGHMLVEFRPQLNQPEIRAAQTVVAARAETSDSSTNASNNSSHPAMPADQALTAAIVKDLVRTAVPPEPPPPPQLLWGRWAETGIAGDMSVALSQAMDGRAGTVGDSQYVLFRADNGTGVLAPGLGAYDFSLQQSQAQFNAAGQAAMAAAVQGGQLHIDFAAQKFNTSLNITSAATGAVALSAAGAVRDDGVFVDRSIAGQAVAGAAALDGKTAGYLFEKAAAGGTLTGITLWSRP